MDRLVDVLVGLCVLILLTGIAGVAFCESHPFEEPYDSFGCVFSAVIIVAVLGLLATGFAFYN